MSLLLFLDQSLNYYQQSIQAKDADVSKVHEFVGMYQTERGKQYRLQQQAHAKNIETEKQVDKLTRKVNRLQSAYERARDAASKEARKARQKRQREREQKRRERERELAERRKYWTTEVAQVKVSLDGFSAFTPGSSRRSSLVVAEKPSDGNDNSTSDDTDKVNLRLSYVIPDSSTWSPRYELSVSTPSSSAKLIYRAEFQNASSETWKDAKVTLSTSQTTFSNLDEKIPELQAWHVKFGTVSETDVAAWQYALRSQSEVDAQCSSKGRAAKRIAKLQSCPPPQQIVCPPQPRVYAPPSNLASVSLFGSASTPAPASTSLFGSSQPTYGARPLLGGPGQVATPATTAPVARFRLAAQLPAEDDDPENNTQLPQPGDQGLELEHQDSIHQSHGLTTTYDLPGSRTLAPSSVHRRHVLAELSLSSITISHVLIPKLRAAAFLKARITNTSSLTFLKGKAGMTVDGTFLGSSSLPSCAPKESFDLSLGVDPYILVTYAKPQVRRGTAGFFNKEDSAVFTRTCWVKNTKSVDVKISVFEQVPISEDEKLKISILEPKGLLKEGDTVPVTAEEIDDGSGGYNGEVSMGKNGEVKWVLDLEKGKEAKLVLAYEVRVPTGCKVLES